MADLKTKHNRVKELFINYDPMGFIKNGDSRSSYDAQALEITNKIDFFESSEEIEESIGLQFYEAYSALEIECSDLAQSLFHLKEILKTIGNSFGHEDLDLKTGGTYEHYKGQLYKVHTVVKHSETLESLVLYEALYQNDTSRMWVRPKEMFLSTVSVGDQVIPRFKLID